MIRAIRSAHEAANRAVAGIRQRFPDDSWGTRRWLRAGRKIHAAAAFALAETLESRQLLAATLDPTFNGGSVLADFATDDYAYSTHVLDDGRVLVAGYANGEGVDSDMAVVRFLKNGQLDTSFGVGGKVRIDFGSTQDQAHGLAVDHQGRIAVVGTTRQTNGGFNFAVARLTADGALDTSFGNGGKVTTDFSGGFDQAYAVAVHNDGLVVSGSASFQFALARYNGDGTLDATFGTNGRVSTYLADFGSEAYALDVDADGRILAAGYAYYGDSTESNIALVRYNPNGSLDSTFGTGGAAVEDLGGYDDTLRAVHVSGQSIYVAGESNEDILVARFTHFGKLDASFGDNGRVTRDVNFEADAAFDVTVHKGAVLVTGHIRENNDRDFVVLKLNLDGSPDESFARGGLFRHDFGSNDDSGQSLAVDADGNIVVAGFAVSGNGHDFAVMRVRTAPPNEAPVANAGAEYSVSEGSGVQLSGAASSDADGSIVSYEWDFDFDGNFSADATGVNATFSAANRDDGTVVVALRVTDDQGATHIVTTTVSVTNVMPNATFATTFGAVTGQSVTFTGGFTDPGLLDTHTVRWNFGDGTVIDFHSTDDPDALNVQHVFTRAGTYTITMTIMDDDGASVAFSRTMTVGSTGLVADTSNPGKTMLVIGGTTGDDKIQIIGLGRLGYLVFVNNRLQGLFQPTGSVSVFGNGGNDKVQIVGRSDLPVKVEAAPKPKKNSVADLLKDLLKGARRAA